MTNPELQKLRTSLADINQELFTIYSNRQNLISQIQKLKVSEKLDAWDPAQEYRVFSKLNFNQSLSFATSYSLLIESQVSLVVDYPQWSKADHLSELSGSLGDYINPILLFIINKQQYERLKLKPKYKNILSEVLND